MGREREPRRRAKGPACQPGHLLSYLTWVPGDKLPPHSGLPPVSPAVKSKHSATAVFSSKCGLRTTSVNAAGELTNRRIPGTFLRTAGSEPRGAKLYF